MKNLKSVDGKELRRVSNWITLKHNYNPRSDNSLWDYVTDENGNHPNQNGFNPDNGLDLMYFRHRGKTYALEQFYVLGGVWVGGAPVFYEEKDGKLGCIGTIFMDGSVFGPYLYGEWDECCEHVRLYEIEN